MRPRNSLSHSVNPFNEIIPKLQFLLKKDQHISILHRAEEHYFDDVKVLQRLFVCIHHTLYSNNTPVDLNLFNQTTYFLFIKEMSLSLI